VSPRASLLLLLAGCPSGPVDSDTGEGTDLGPLACAWDTDDLPASAGELVLDTLTQGTICPRGDQDWYRITLPNSDRLLDVSLTIDAPIAPLELTWSLWDSSGAHLLDGPAADEAARAGRPLRVTHGVDTNALLLQVHDITGVAEDPSHPYQLKVMSAPDLDAHEPNNDDAHATPLASNALTGRISARGDEDWYRLDVPDHGVLTASLSSAVADYQPRLRLVDPAGVEHTSAVNLSGTVSPTDLRWVLALDQPGAWFLVVDDDDQRDDDRDVPYTLQASLRSDPDVHEPNDHPDLATDLGASGCAATWSASTSAQGTLASTGDVDWYQLSLSGDCSGGVLEATLDFAGSPALPADLLAELRLVHEAPGSACSLDQDCQVLATPCSSDASCEHLGSRCLPSEGACAGAGFCLPTSVCAANEVVETAPGGDPGGLRLLAPLTAADTVWLAVADNRGDAFAPDNDYVLSVRTLADPDPNEPNDVFTARPPTSSEAGMQTPRAVELPVHDCVPPTDPIELAAWVPDCCDDTTWVSGAVAWKYDQDWFRYAHPCPGGDCMVRVRYQADPGPVDLFMQVFRGNSLWFDGLAATVDLPAQPALAGSYGGLADTDTCFYASQKHTGAPFWYYLAIRDTIRLSDSQPQGGRWDADPLQGYRVCVEKIADGCATPCTLYTDGCGTP